MNPIITYLILALVLFGLIKWFISIYNTLIMLKNNVDKAFANIDVVLKQRADEIPNLINVVKETRVYETGTLEKLTQLRTAYMQALTTDEKVNVNNELSENMRSILAVAENYPQLKAIDAFTQLQQRVSGLEDAISDRREFFNESVNMYNIGIKEFPNVLMAFPLGYTARPFLLISKEEKAYNGVTF